MTSVLLPEERIRLIGVIMSKLLEQQAGLAVESPILTGVTV